MWKATESEAYRGAVAVLTFAYDKVATSVLGIRDTPVKASAPVEVFEERQSSGL